MPPQAPGALTSRSGQSIKESERKKLAREADNIKEPAATKRKQAGRNKENHAASQGKAQVPEFKITPLPVNKTALRGTPVNLQARKGGLPLPKSIAAVGGSTIKPATVITGQRRDQPARATPSICKLTPEKAAELAAARNPLGAVPTGQNGTTAHNLAWTPPARSSLRHLSYSKRPETPQGSQHATQPGLSARMPAATPIPISRRRRSPSPQDDDFLGFGSQDNDEAEPGDQDFARPKAYRVSDVHLHMPSDDENNEDEEEGIPHNSDDENGGSGDYVDEPFDEDEPDHVPEDYNDEHDPTNDLYNDWHEGEFDDAPEVQDKDYDSDVPLAQRRRLSARRMDDADPRAGYPKASRIRERAEGKHPCVADYEPDAQHILAQAIPIYKALVSSQNAYPDKLTELTWAKQAWWEAADTLEIELAPNHECTKIIIAYSWHLHGEMKTTARALVETVYHFQASGQPDIQRRNRDCAAALRTGDAFVFQKRGKTANEHEGLYQAEIIQRMVNRLYFKNKKDDGIALKEKYSPFPMVALALILAAIECAIDEWSDGSFTKVPFTEDKYAPIYRHHLQALRQYESMSEDLQVLTQIC